MNNANTNSPIKATNKKARWSREHVRALAWVAGSATFFTGVAVLGAAPKLAATATGNSTGKATSTTATTGSVKKYVFVVQPPAAASVAAVGAPVTSTGGGTTTTGGGTSTGGGAAPPPPAPVCTTSPSGVTTCH
jgi:hypothetical protein